MTGRDAEREQLAAALVSEGWDAEDALDLAVTLLPVVVRIANERAAAELRVAADEAHAEAYTEQRLPWVVIRERADHLDPS